MELASRVYDVVTNPDNISDEIKDLLPQITPPDVRAYWRRVLRMAALCHDIGHLPFSHAAEKELLPPGWDHERLTREIILSSEMKGIWNSITPPLRPEDIVKLAIGPKKAKDLAFTDWESILSEIIVGDAFGVDRIDYLLRDSHHVGVAYGKFDHYRLIDTLRILTTSPESREPALGITEEGIQSTSPESREPALGITEGGIQSAEALMLARYLMYSQVYFHHVRRIYDIHLKDFLREWLAAGVFSTDVSDHLGLTDNEVTAAFMDSALDHNAKGHQHARRIVCRKHYKMLYERNPKEVAINPEAGTAIYEAIGAMYGPEHFRHDRYPQKSGSPEFPVLLRDGQIVSSLALSETLNKVPVVSIDYVFADRAILDKAKKWLETNRNDVIQPKREAGNG
jgi:HD superfamily phosphohydrolase